MLLFFIPSLPTHNKIRYTNQISRKVRLQTEGVLRSVAPQWREAVSKQKQIKAVLFDLDDTLIDWSKKTVGSGNVSRRHINNIHTYLSQHGHALPENDAFYALFHEILVDSWTEAKKTWAGVNFAKVVAKTLETAKLDMAQIEMEDILRAYDWQPVPGIRPYDDTHDVLTHLKQNSYKIGLITNSMQPMWMRDIELEAYGLMSYLDTRLTSGDTGYMKPHPYIYLLALKQLNIRPHEAVFVGDRPSNDIVGANHVGMTSVWIDPPHLNYDLKGIEPHFTIETLSELLPVLDQLEQKEPVSQTDSVATNLL